MPKAAKTPIPAANHPATPAHATPGPARQAQAFDPIHDLISRWPLDQPLAVLHSGDPARATDHARWSLIARPTSATTSTPTSTTTSPTRERGSPLAFSDRLASPAPCRAPIPITPPHLPQSALPRSPVGLVYPPFTTGHLGYLSYDAGRLLEPTAQHAKGSAIDDRAWPLSHWLRIEDALIYDHAHAQWWGLGDHESLLASLSPRHPGTSTPRHLDTWTPCHLSPPTSPTSTTGRPAYLAAVRRALDYIRAGDVYQVNLAHRLTATFSGSPRDLFLKLSNSARPWYGAYLEFTDADGRERAIASASPELFLDFDPKSRHITTRPMKGTRRGDTDPRELLASPKDQAELNMITDLMRNDLGRICDFNSIQVASPRTLEHHGSPPSSLRRSVASSPPSLLQTTSTITGTVRPSLTPSDILAATFPGGSITGAPKIRAMQIIDELEPHRRGPYCGAIGFLGDDRRLTLSIAIRTALITGGTPSERSESGVLDYSVGAGIVADSDPESEWEETLAKAAILGGHTA